MKKALVGLIEEKISRLVKLEALKLEIVDEEVEVLSRAQLLKGLASWPAGVALLFLACSVVLRLPFLSSRRYAGQVWDGIRRTPVLQTVPALIRISVLSNVATKTRVH